jgi:hypothetical protein
MAAVNIQAGNENLGDISAKEIFKVPLPCKSDVSKFAIVIKDVFSKEECDVMIADTESKGYGTALLNVGGGREVLDRDYRRSSRCIVDSFEQAEEIWKRVKEHVPSSLDYYGDQWEAVGLNERLRFLRYNPGDFFSPHCDGCYQRSHGERSFITLQLYLNEGFEGGATAFLDRMSDAVYPLEPKTGNVLIFQHDIYHSGAEVTKGIKYAVRTDVMYRRAFKSSL